MGRFRFRLQRVLDYRTSLVEAQEAELGRRAFQLRTAEQALASVMQRQRGLIDDMSTMADGPVRADRAVAAWDYWDHLRRAHERSEADVRARAAEVEEARVRLTDLRREEKVMEKLKERQGARAEVAERQQEAKDLDDLTTTRLGHAPGEGGPK
ncbi:MAG: flagellar export protein FliJ [Anaerolineae bacterium]